MPDFIIILQEPKHEGNVGAVARCMKNFGFLSLYLVNPCELGDECFRRSKHAKDVIMNSKKFDTLKDVRFDVDYLVGTSGIVNLNDKHHIRNPKTPREFIEYSKRLDKTRVGLLFGREDYGLYEDELLLCDMLINIPTSEDYPIMNLSHAVAVVLYELASADLKISIHGHRKASKFEREKLFQQFRDLLDSVDYPSHKRENTEVLFRRVLGRATPSKWEFHTLMGVFGRASKRIKKYEERNKKKNNK
jgi:TrmH family RNA methyltransferase